MSELPPRPSIEQLRKQAKERLDTMPGAKLADAQFEIAYRLSASCRSRDRAL